MSVNQNVDYVVSIHHVELAPPNVATDLCLVDVHLLIMDRFLVHRAQPPDVIPDMTHNVSAVSSLADLFRWPHANSCAAASSGFTGPTDLLHAGMVKSSSLTS